MIETGHRDPDKTKDEYDDDNRSDQLQMNDDEHEEFEDFEDFEEFEDYEEYDDDE